MASAGVSAVPPVAVMGPWPLRPAAPAGAPAAGRAGVDQPGAADDWVDDFQVTQDPNADDEGNDGNCKKLVIDEETDQFGPYSLDHQCAPAIADFE
jgi:hypothetical protein